MTNLAVIRDGRETMKAIGLAGKPPWRTLECPILDQFS
jgi:hypothetical protein